MGLQDLTSKQKMEVELIGGHHLFTLFSSCILTVDYSIESLIKSYFLIVRKSIQDR